ncbi:MAG TPA: hypothetical protein VKV40_21280 [Ktedonobacteraceae bacterium]|nr:hypothetical protein [Ktedonobacteraceae bacterium]
MENKTKNEDMLRKTGQWLRVTVLTLTTLGPIVNTLLERVRQRAEQGKQQAAVAQVKGKVQEAQQAALQRLEALTLVSRQQAAEQAQQLSTQAQQLKQQAEQLRKALREEAKQRAKLAKEVRKASANWSQEVIKRGGDLTEDLVEQSARLSQDLKERGEQITEDLKERAGTLTQEISKRTGKVAQDLSERGEELIHRRGRMLSIIGFGAGCVAAAAVTFIVVRRLVQRNSGQDEQIELPLNNLANGATPQEEETGQPAGEIVMLNADGTIVTIVEPENEGE